MRLFSLLFIAGEAGCSVMHMQNTQMNTVVATTVYYNIPVTVSKC